MCTCESNSPGSRVRPSVRITLAFAGYVTCPRVPTALMRDPSITITALATGALPVPSMSVPPSSTSVCPWAPVATPAHSATATIHGRGDFIGSSSVDPREINESAFDVHRRQLHADPIADVHTFEAADDPSFNRKGEEPRPGAL